MKPRRSGRIKGTCVNMCRCGRRIAGKPGSSVTCLGCQRTQVISRAPVVRRKVQLYL